MNENKTSYQLEEVTREGSHFTYAFGNVVLSYSASTPQRGYLERNVQLVNALAAR